MDVLVTGGAGYVGSVVAHQLLRSGHRVRVLDSLLHGGEALLGLYPADSFEFIRGDVRSTEDVQRALDGVDAVVHLAAIVGDPACARQPDLAKAVNLDGALKTFTLSQKAGVGRFLFASTCSNYGKMADPTAYVTETSELRPVSLYAETKVQVEQALLGAQNGIAPTVLRFATIFGPSPRMRFDLTVNQFTMELMTRRELLVYGEQFWRPYVHVRDAARAVEHVLAAPKDLVAAEVFNVGSTDQNYRKGELVDLIADRVGGGLDIEYVHKEEDPRDYRVSFEKIEQTLDFEVSRTVNDGIHEVMQLVGQKVITDVDDPRYRN